MTAYPAIRIGPRDRGRSYGVLEHGLAAEEFARFQPLLEDFSLALAAWADLGLKRFVALTPLNAARSAHVLWRGRFIGAGELGTVAVANGLYLSAEAMEAIEGRAHRLLPALPEPDGAPFGGSAVTAEPGPATPSPLAPFGLEWRDHVVEVLDGAEPEAVLVSALDGIWPETQVARVDGWASTGAFQASGAFDPAEAFRLIVRPHDEARGAAAPGRREVQVRDGRVVTAAEPEPAVWRLWRAIEQAAGSGQASAGQASSGRAASDWKPGWLALPADRVGTLGLLQKAAPLTLEDRLDLIAGAVEAAASDAELSETMGTAAGQALLRLAASADRGEDALRYLEAGLTQARFGDEAAREIARSAPLDARLFAMDKTGLNRALDLGLIDRVAAPEGAEALAALPSEALMMMLGESLRRAEATPAMRRLAVGLIRRLAVGETLSRRYAAAGVTTLVGMQARPQDTGLATAAIAELVREFPAIDPGAYAAHAIRPVVRGDVRLDPPAFVDAMRAAVRLLEPAA